MRMCVFAHKTAALPSIFKGCSELHRTLHTFLSTFLHVLEHTPLSVTVSCSSALSLILVSQGDFCLFCCSIKRRCEWKRKLNHFGWLACSVASVRCCPFNCAYWPQSSCVAPLFLTFARTDNILLYSPSPEVDWTNHQRVQLQGTRTLTMKAITTHIRGYVWSMQGMYVLISGDIYEAYAESHASFLAWLLQSRLGNLQASLGPTMLFSPKHTLLSITWHHLWCQLMSRRAQFKSGRT